MHQLKAEPLGEPLFKKVLEGTYPEENIDSYALNKANRVFKPSLTIPKSKASRRIALLNINNLLMISHIKTLF